MRASIDECIVDHIVFFRQQFKIKFSIHSTLFSPPHFTLFGSWRHDSFYEHLNLFSSSILQSRCAKYRTHGETVRRFGHVTAHLSNRQHQINVQKHSNDYVRSSDILCLLIYFVLRSMYVKLFR